MGDHSELVKTIFDHIANLFVKAEFRVEDDTKVSGLRCDKWSEVT